MSEIVSKSFFSDKNLVVNLDIHASQYLSLYTDVLLRKHLINYQKMK